MRLRKVRESYERHQVFTLYPLGDLHFGSANCDEDKLHEVIGAIAADPDARWLGMGDMVEAIAPNDKRWRAGGMIPEVVENQDHIGDYYVAKVSDLLAPIADKLWSYGDGNHERKFNEHYYTNLSVRVLERIGRSECYTGWAAITRVQFSEGNHRSALQVFHSHGWQAGRTDGAKVNYLDTLMGDIEGCDLYLQGHSHSSPMKTKARLSIDRSCSKLVQKVCYGIHTRSFLRVYQLGESGYAEVAQYPPSIIGVVRVLLYPRESGVYIEVIQ